jgi:formylglycine-generating enzyme required for sulfatase activity
MSQQPPDSLPKPDDKDNGLRARKNRTFLGDDRVIVVLVLSGLLSIGLTVAGMTSNKLVSLWIIFLAISSFIAAVYLSWLPKIKKKPKKKRTPINITFALVELAILIVCICLHGWLREIPTPCDTAPAEKQPEPAFKSFNFTTATVNSKGEVTTQPRGQPARYFVEDLGCGVTLEMVEVPGGTFLMGSSESEVQRALADAKLKPGPDEDMFDNEKPQHQVNVPTFFISKFEVTQAQWRAVAAWRPVKQSIKPEPSNHKGDGQLPVEQVTWEDATEFCERLSKYRGRAYRLPTEAEWEYACRAGTTTPFAFGETITPDLVNYESDRPYGEVPPREYKEGGTLPVGWFRVANRFGLYDMPGNVKEWCLDGWHEDYKGAPANGGEWWSQSSTLRVVHGCGWQNDAFQCRCAFRDGVRMDKPQNNIGLRVVTVMQP